MLMILPCASPGTWAAKLCDRKTGALRFVSRCAAQLSSVTDLASSGSKREALFTRHVSGPNAPLASPISRSGTSARARSPSTITLRPPPASISRFSISASAREALQWMATAQPSCARSRAIRRPIRRAAPVMRTERVNSLFRKICWSSGLLLINSASPIKAVR